MNLQSLLNRLRFGSSEQQIFLSRLTAMNGAGIPLRSAFETFSRFPSTPEEEQIARLSLHNIGQGSPFAHRYDRMGWFPRHIARLLEAGEESKALGQSLQVALDFYRPQASAWRTVLLPNLRWPLTVAIALVICIFLYLQQDLFLQVLGSELSTSQETVFAIGKFLVQYGMLAALVAAVVIAAFVFLLRTGTGLYRDALDRFPVFIDYRRAFTAQLLPMMVGFMQGGMAPLETMDTLLTLHRRGYGHYRLREIRAAIAGGMDLAEALGRTLLEARHRALLQSLAPVYPGRAYRAISELAKMVRTDVEARYKVFGQRLALVCLALILGLVYGILDVIYTAPANIT